MTPEQFYTDKDHVVDFLNKFSSEFKDLSELKLDTIKKFQLYLEKYPDYDCWSKAFYVKYKPKSIDLKSLHVVDLGETYVSMKGKFCQLRGWKNGVVLDTFGLSPKGYPRVSIFSRNFNLHRILACTFLKREGDLKGTPLHLLHTNHKDGVKTNFSLDNLEWSTPQNNALHAVSNRLRPSRVFKMTLYQRVGDHPEGTSFFLRNADVRNIGIVLTPINRAIQTNNRLRAYTSTWEIVDFQEGMIFGLPTDIKKEDLITRKSLLI